MTVIAEAEECDVPVVDERARLRVERNRWFFVCLSLSVGVAVAVCASWWAFSQNHKEVIFVKLTPNGGWSVVSYEPQDEQLYFKTTVDSLLERFAISRYGIKPETITDDWGEAGLFMSAELQGQFSDPRGFNGAQKIKQIQKSKNSAKVVVRDIEHYDAVTWSDEGNAERVIRSNIYLTRTFTIGGQEKEPEPLVLNVQWKLIDKKTLAKQSMIYLRLNPLGLEVVSYRLTKEKQ
ncbi:conserved hypothetical protein [Vibrio nigripulchritudo FTn2]|uniref:VirB8/TrbF family protein n=1 Tax=Vibrio nigripulchritudo TaxID=28173 RepID=UPI0003B210DA|nr:VirB8/TrbF family protein [Vibrio nigripulchritudo]CCN39725.1 conserved hypothetical protein [Vibrio nigripulchritudo FTn2]